MQEEAQAMSAAVDEHLANWDAAMSSAVTARDDTDRALETAKKAVETVTAILAVLQDHVSRLTAMQSYLEAAAPRPPVDVATVQPAA
jgi:hypothetical protein